MTVDTISDMFSSQGLTNTDWLVQLNGSAPAVPPGWDAVQAGKLSATVPLPLHYAHPSLMMSQGEWDGGKLSFYLGVESFRLDQIWKNGLMRGKHAGMFFREPSEFVVEDNRTLVRTFTYRHFLGEERLTLFYSNFVWSLRLIGYRAALVAEARISDASGNAGVWNKESLLSTAKTFMHSVRVS